MTTPNKIVLSYMEDELRAVIDCYVSDKMPATDADAIMMAMERASAYALLRVYGAELANYPTMFKVLTTHMDGVSSGLMRWVRP